MQLASEQMPKLHDSVVAPAVGAQCA